MWKRASPIAQSLYIREKAPWWVTNRTSIGEVSPKMVSACLSELSMWVERLAWDNVSEMKSWDRSTIVIPRCKSKSLLIQWWFTFSWDDLGWIDTGHSGCERFSTVIFARSRSPDSEFEALLADWVEQDAKIMIYYDALQKILWNTLKSIISFKDV